MNMCSRCGNPVQENLLYCPFCGGHLIEGPSAITMQHRALNVLHGNLKAERLCWRIIGGIYFGFFILCFSFFLLFLALRRYYISAIGVQNTYTALFLFGLVSVVFLTLSCIHIGTGRIIARRMEEVYNNCGKTIDRGEKVSLIIKGVLLNPFATIFILLNFAFIQNRKHLLKQTYLAQTRTNV